MKYTDKIDATTTISLYEYGFIRRPDTGKTLICLNPSDQEHTKDNPPNIVTMIIDFDDVIEALEDVDEGFFSFIGQDRKEVMENVKNEYLTDYIQSLDMYNGHFTEMYRY